MEFDGFDGDEGNRGKYQKHGLSLPEIESVSARPVIILPDKENFQGERRFRAIGSTLKARRALVVFTWRSRLSGKLLRPISARYMHREKVMDYEKAYPFI
ncbi:MAG: BrnT family toxin [Hyphomicrobiales bacterium]|nr:BrnT family toxin [Hyphomicrobiales bacterium]MBV8427539.1 BrnT family toxin [Hyphomicrobiales bacterium]